MLRFGTMMSLQVTLSVGMDTELTGGDVAGANCLELNQLIII